MINRPRKIWKAILLHLLAPGLGQYYNSKFGRAIVFFSVGALVYLIGFFITYVSESAIVFVLTLLFAAAIWIYILADTIILTRNNKQYFYATKYNNSWQKYLAMILALMAISAAVNFSAERFLLEGYRLPSGSMENTLLAGDMIIAKKCGYNSILPGELVIFGYPPNPGVLHIKRCVARGNQSVEIVDKKLYVDDQFMVMPPHAQNRDERILPYSEEFGGLRDNMPRVTVPEGKIFVLGDNRDNSLDSRFYGFVNSDLIIGKPIFIYWSWRPDKDAPSLEDPDLSDIFKNAAYKISHFIQRTRWERIGLPDD
jgi:signal peptidase I